MIINGKRALAYIVTIDEIRPIPGYDRVEQARTKGWWCITKLGEFKVGDNAVYFEVDSQVPADDKRFEFLSQRHFKIKTLKMCKVYSQGLLLPVSEFPELENKKVGDDVTDILKVTYAVQEDNERKADDPNQDDKYRSMMLRHKKLFSNPIIKLIIRFDTGKRMMFFFLGKKDDESMRFPTCFPYMHKTDEERCENIPWVLGYDKPMIVTEKLDGTSSTYILERKGRSKYEFYVLSRNIRQKTINPKFCHEKNIYWDMALKYDIEGNLKQYLKANKELSYVCIQGEAVGSVQGNPLKLNEDELYVFNFIRSDIGRIPSLQAKEIIEKMGMKFVPILDTNYYIPSDMETFKQYAAARSAVNPNVNREGVVLRDPTSDLSFKNVSREYLLKHGG